MRQEPPFDIKRVEHYHNLPDFSADYVSNPSQKRQIIPTDWAHEVDSIMSSLGENYRRLIVEDKDIVRESDELAKLPPEKLITELSSRWNLHNWHEEFFLEPALPSIIEDDPLAISPKQVQAMIAAHDVFRHTDRSLTVASGAIKKCVERWIAEDPGIQDSEQFRMLLTPPIESHMLSYDIEHSIYRLAQATGDERLPEIKAGLLSRYHANDEELFSQRWALRFAELDKLSAEELKERITSMKIDDEFKQKHALFTDGNPRREAIRDLLIFDNLVEHENYVSLVGLSAVVIWKEALRYMNDRGIVDNDGSVYSLNDDQFASGLESLLEVARHEYLRRASYYMQTGYTCGPATTMMCLDALGKKVAMDRNTEYSLYSEFYSPSIEGSHMSAMARHISEHDLDVSMNIAGQDTLENIGNVPQSVFNDVKREFDAHLAKAAESGVKIRLEQEVNSGSIRKSLENSSVCIISGMMGSIQHYIFVNGYRNGLFHIHDPVSAGPRLISPGELDSFVGTPFGSGYIEAAMSQQHIDRFIEVTPEFIRHVSKL